MMTVQQLEAAMAPLNERQARLTTDQQAITAEIASLRAERTQQLAAGAERSAVSPITARLSQLEDEGRAVADALQAVAAELAPYAPQIMTAYAADAEAQYHGTVAAAAPARDALLLAVRRFVLEELPPLRAAFNQARRDVDQAATAAERARKAAGMPGEFYGTLPLFTGEYGALAAQHIQQLLEIAETLGVNDRSGLLPKAAAARARAA